MTAEDDFDEFVRARWSATARLAYALTLDHQKAEDLAQDAFTKLWFHWRKLRTGSPEAYLRKIVTSTFLSGRRRRWHGEHPTDTPPESTVDAGTTQVEERLALREAMARLTPRQRAAVYLRYAERPEPADPAVPVQLRIKRRQVRRRATAAAISAAAVTAVVVVASSALGSLRSAEPGVATSSSTAPTPALQTQHLDFKYTPLPSPWSDEPAFTTQPDSLKYAPAFYVARGSIPNESWAVASYIRSGCLVVTDEGPAKAFGGADACFTENWQPGQLAQYRAVPADVPNLSSPMHLTLVMGAVAADARQVRVTAGGKTYDTDAVGTPNSSRLRFFALVIDAADVTSVTPLTATGQQAPAPRGR